MSGEKREGATIVEYNPLNVPVLSLYFQFRKINARISSYSNEIESSSNKWTDELFIKPYILLLSSLSQIHSFYPGDNLMLDIHRIL